MLSKLKATLSLIGTLATCLFLIGGLSGCSALFGSKREATDPHSTKQMKEKPSKTAHAFSPNRRDAVVVQRGSKFGGAAIRPIERQHVLYFQNPSVINETDNGQAAEVLATEAKTREASADALKHGLELLHSQLTTTPSPAESTVSQPVAKAAKGEAQGRSFYELSRWERYCAGKPNSLDIAFIKRVGGHDSLPYFLKDSCSPKKRL